MMSFVKKNKFLYIHPSFLQYLLFATRVHIGLQARCKGFNVHAA